MSGNTPAMVPKRGAVIVEMAMVLPIIFLLVAGFLELSRVSMLRHAADTAAYEGARAGVVAGAQSQDAIDAAQALLNATQLRGGEVQVIPTQILESTPSIVVIVKIPVANNTWIPPFFFKNTKVVSSVTLITERPSAIQLSGIDAAASGALGISALGIGL